MLRFYMPRRPRETWKEFHLGVGVYTMQGFEKCNSESKQIFKNITDKKNNKTTNVVIQILKILQYNYKHKTIERCEKREKRWTNKRFIYNLST